MTSLMNHKRVRVRARLPCCKRPHDAYLQLGTLQLLDVSAEDVRDGHEKETSAAGVLIQLHKSDEPTQSNSLPCITCLDDTYEANCTDGWRRLTATGVVEVSGVKPPRAIGVPCETSSTGTQGDGEEDDMRRDACAASSCDDVSAPCTDTTLACVTPCMSVARVRPLYQDMYKVVYVVDKKAAATKRPMALTVASTVCVLTMRIRAEHARIFQNNNLELEDNDEDAVHCGAGGPGSGVEVVVHGVESGHDAGLKRHVRNGRVVPYNQLRNHNQYVVDEALPTTARFLDTNTLTAHDCAGQYQQGTKLLVPQICVHNVDLPMMNYEVGCVARVPNAGENGLNGCLCGIHVHISESDALQHAQTMGVQMIDPYGAHNSTVLGKQPVPVYDGPDDKIKWFKWNSRPNPWNDNEDTKCLSCLMPMNSSSRKYAVMDCGHGFLCAACAAMAQETMHCPECSIRALRISAYPW